MTTELDDRMDDVLGDMPTLPSNVRIEALRRLARIEAAMADGMLDAGAIIMPFRDLCDSDVVLSITMVDDITFMDISTAEEGIAISHGYTFRTTGGGIEIGVDRDHRMTSVDHGSLSHAQLITERVLGQIDEANALMATHHAFRHLRREG